MMFHRLMRTNFVYYILAIHLLLSLSVNLTSHFSNLADFRHLKTNEILPAHTKTPYNTTHKIASQYFEFRYHFLTLQKKFPITFEQGCSIPKHDDYQSQGLCYGRNITYLVWVFHHGSTYPRSLCNETKKHVYAYQQFVLLLRRVIRFVHLQMASKKKTNILVFSVKNVGQVLPLRDPF